MLPVTAQSSSCSCCSFPCSASAHKHPEVSQSLEGFCTLCYIDCSSITCAVVWHDSVVAMMTCLIWLLLLCLLQGCAHAFLDCCDWVNSTSEGMEQLVNSNANCAMPSLVLLTQSRQSRNAIGTCTSPATQHTAKCNMLAAGLKP